MDKASHWEAWRELAALGASRGVASHAAEPCAIVLAGGRGTRLMRLAEQYEGAAVPKQFCSFGTNRSLLQHTLDRVARSVAPERTLVVVQRDQLGWAARQLHGRKVRMLAQPSDAGTGMAFLLALTEMAQRHPQGEVLVTPADHGFLRRRPLERALAQAFARAHRSRRSVVLLGAEADSPRTDFGWIIPGCEQGGCRPVNRFVEKPYPAVASELLAEGALWNTMLAVGTTAAWLAQFARRFPLLVRALVFHAGLPATEQGEYLERLYDSLDGFDLSRDVLEGSDALEVMTLPRASGWSDLGTEERLLAHLSRPRPLPRAEQALVQAS